MICSTTPWVIFNLKIYSWKLVIVDVLLLTTTNAYVKRLETIDILSIDTIQVMETSKNGRIRCVTGLTELVPYPQCLWWFGAEYLERRGPRERQ